MAAFPTLYLRYLAFHLLILRLIGNSMFGTGLTISVDRKLTDGIHKVFFLLLLQWYLERAIHLIMLLDQEVSFPENNLC